METVTFAPPAARRADRIFACIVLAVYALSAAIPLRLLDRVGVTLCPFRGLTGLPCPGCGMTHAFVALAHGNIAAAWHYNALSLPLFAFGLFWLMARLTGDSARPVLSRRAEGILVIAALVLALAYDAYRICVPTARPF
ncbi:MAG TPA: DUF2752 domain-containing protein [Armatimonadota bacterium]|jgi:hypothetical protein